MVSLKKYSANFRPTLLGKTNADLKNLPKYAKSV